MFVDAYIRHSSSAPSAGLFVILLVHSVHSDEKINRYCQDVKSCKVLITKDFKIFLPKSTIEFQFLIAIQMKLVFEFAIFQHTIRTAKIKHEI